LENLFFPLFGDGKKVEKEMEKVENPFLPNPFFERSRNLILFCYPYFTENKIVHNQ
jgi:hypothetical protein